MVERAVMCPVSCPAGSIWEFGGLSRQMSRGRPADSVGLSRHLSNLGPNGLKRCAGQTLPAYRSGDVPCEDPR